MALRLPRVYLVRHGETEWSLSGQHTGKSDIPLTANGENIIRTLGPKIVGSGKPLDPHHIQNAFISPRQRAQKTFQLLYESSEIQPASTTESLVQEWDYGRYEGITAKDIRDKYDPNWDIWVDGCPEGESSEQMTKRVDEMIQKIVSLTQTHHEVGSDCPGAGDILIVSHGHFTRCFLARWCELELTKGRLFAADAGAISICKLLRRRALFPGPSANVFNISLPKVVIRMEASKSEHCSGSTFLVNYRQKPQKEEIDKPRG